MVTAGASTTKTMTARDFDGWVFEAENTDTDYELIAGEIKAMVSNQYASQIAMIIGSYITMFVLQNNLGYISGADGGYRVGDERYMPDVGFISKERQPQPNRDAYNPLAPDLAVEVVSPSDDLRLLSFKISNYVASGTVVWVVYPDVREVHIHTQQGAVMLGEDDSITGGDVLPDFSLAVKAIFPDETPANKGDDKNTPKAE
jgi:Uma2 family endonuclease